MSDAPRWLRWSAGVAVVALLIALARPPVAGLVLRALVVLVAAVLVIAVVATAVHGLEPAEGLARRPDPREPGDVPRELAIITEDLRATSRRGNVPVSALRSLRAALQHRLWYHHGLSTATPEHDGAIRSRVSPAAYALLESAKAKQEYPAIPAADLPALIQEVERL